MSDTGKLKPSIIRPGSLRSKFVVLGAVTGGRMPEDGNAYDPATWRRIEGDQSDQGLTFEVRGGATTSGFVNSDEEIVLTNTSTYACSVAHFNRISVAAEFTITFQMWLSGGNGADGIVMGFHNDTRGKAARGYTGGGLGWFNASGVSAIAPSVCCEFDIYYGSSGYTPLDSAHGIRNNHMQLVYVPGDGVFPTDLDTPVDLGSASYLEDSTWHDVTVTYDIATQTLTYDLDSGAFTTSAVVDLETLLGDRYAYWAFSAANGGLSQNHKVRNITISAQPEDPSVLRSTEDQ